MNKDNNKCYESVGFFMGNCPYPFGRICRWKNDMCDYYLGSDAVCR